MAALPFGKKNSVTSNMKTKNQERLNRLAEFVRDTNRMNIKAHKDISSASRELLKAGWLYWAYEGFSKIQDKEGLLEIIKSADPIFDVRTLNQATTDYIGNELYLKNLHSFYNWADELGYPNKYAFELPKVLKMAYELSSEYDIGIGIAKGGLFSSYVFGLMGLDIKIVEAHRKEDSASFKWISNFYSEEIKDKKIIVLDKDVDTGRTSNKVLNELQKYNPKEISIALNLDAVDERFFSGGGTMVSKISKGYNQIYFPSKISYQNFDEAVKILSNNL